MARTSSRKSMTWQIYSAGAVGLSRLSDRRRFSWAGQSFETFGSSTNLVPRRPFLKETGFRAKEGPPGMKFCGVRTVVLRKGAHPVQAHEESLTAVGTKQATDDQRFRSRPTSLRNICARRPLATNTGVSTIPRGVRGLGCSSRAVRAVAHPAPRLTAHARSQLAARRS
jgi:hypothetical protein